MANGIPIIVNINKQINIIPMQILYIFPTLPLVIAQEAWMASIGPISLSTIRKYPNASLGAMKKKGIIKSKKEAIIIALETET